MGQPCRRAMAYSQGVLRVAVFVSCALLVQSIETQNSRQASGHVRGSAHVDPTQTPSWDPANEGTRGQFQNAYGFSDGEWDVITAEFTKFQDRALEAVSSERRYLMKGAHESLARLVTRVVDLGAINWKAEDSPYLQQVFEEAREFFVRVASDMKYCSSEYDTRDVKKGEVFSSSPLRQATSDLLQTGFVNSFLVEKEYKFGLYNCSAYEATDPNGSNALDHEFRFVSNSSELYHNLNTEYPMSFARNLASLRADTFLMNRHNKILCKNKFGNQFFLPDGLDVLISVNALYAHVRGVLENSLKTCDNSSSLVALVLHGNFTEMIDMLGSAVLTPLTEAPDDTNIREAEMRDAVRKAAGISAHFCMYGTDVAEKALQNLFGTMERFAVNAVQYGGLPFPGRTDQKDGTCGKLAQDTTRLRTRGDFETRFGNFVPRPKRVLDDHTIYNLDPYPSAEPEDDLSPTPEQLEDNQNTQVPLDRPNFEGTTASPAMTTVLSNSKTSTYTVTTTSKPNLSSSSTQSVPSSSSTSPSSVGGGGACFPEEATVELRNGNVVSMSALRVGDHVRVADELYSPVILFTHADPSVRTVMRKLTLRNTENATKTLTASESHYLYSNGVLTPSSSVRVGDHMKAAACKGCAMENFFVQTVASIAKRGLYNPQTAHGDIVVNGVECSTFTSAVHPQLAHALLSPLAAASRVGLYIPDLSNVFSKGAPFALAALGERSPMFEL